MIQNQCLLNSSAILICINIPLLNRVMSAFVCASTLLYLFQPLVSGNRETPTQVNINGNDYWPIRIFLMIYLGQFIHGVCVGFGITAYDDVFIQCIMVMSYRFKTLGELLKLLNYDGLRDEKRDRKILVDVYKMHLSALE